MKTLEELAANGVHGQALSDAIYEDIMGFPPTRPAAERTPEERRVSLERFFAIMNTLTDAELDDNFMAAVRQSDPPVEDDRTSVA